MAKILIATDDSALYAVLDAELSSFGFETLWAEDARDAFDQCLLHAPDAVMIDSGITVHPVWELCEMLRSHPDIPPALPIFLVADTELSQRKAETYDVAEVIRRAHDTSLFRELLFHHVSI